MLTKQDVAFRHYRKFDANGEVNPRAGATVAFPKGDAGVYGAAYCSTDDNFIYSFGRNLALERLNEGVGDVEDVAKEYPALFPKSIRLGLVDNLMENLGYTHITRSKNRRKNKDEA